MRAGVFRYSPCLLMNGTEAELGPLSDESQATDAENAPKAL
jgi:hypothetical protein